MTMITIKNFILLPTYLTDGQYGGGVGKYSHIVLVISGPVKRTLYRIVCILVVSVKLLTLQ